MSSPFHKDLEEDEATWLYPIPGRDFARGEITHKLWSDMNRQERRAVTAAWRRSTPWISWEHTINQKEQP